MAGIAKFCQKKWQGSFLYKMRVNFRWYVSNDKKTTNSHLSYGGIKWVGMAKHFYFLHKKVTCRDFFFSLKKKKWAYTFNREESVCKTVWCNWNQFHCLRKKDLIISGHYLNKSGHCDIFKRLQTTLWNTVFPRIVSSLE